MSVFQEILTKFKQNKKQYWILLDPDDFTDCQAEETAKSAEESGVSAILVGGSLIHCENIENFITQIKKSSSLPVILFPGDAAQVAKNADAILFMSLISGRNPDFLIGQQVKGAVQIAKSKVEPISMGYMLVESGTTTSVEFMSNTRPLPADKPNIAAAHALAAQFLGMSMLYLEAGSGAKNPVPDKIISAVKKAVKIPVIVGGGIRDAETAKQKLLAGADILVTGNMLASVGNHSKNGLEIMKEIADLTDKFQDIK